MCFARGRNIYSAHFLDVVYRRNINLLRSNYESDRRCLHNDSNLIIRMNDGAGESRKVRETDLLHNILGLRYEH